MIAYHQTIRKPASQRHRVRSSTRSPYFHLSGIPGSLFSFLRSQRRAWETAFFFFGSSTQVSKTMPISGPCTKCIISHAILLSKPLFPSNFSSSATSHLFRAFILHQRSSLSHPEQSPQDPYPHKMLFKNS